MKTLEIPGGTARFREKNEIKVRHRRLVESAAVAAASALSKLPDDPEQLKQLNLRELNLTRAEARALYDLQDATIIATLVDWTLSGALPDEDTIGDLDPELYDALSYATQDVGVDIAGGVNFDPTNPSDPEFEASPTEPSAGSAADLRADQASPSPSTHPSGGPSTSTGQPTQDSPTSST